MKYINDSKITILNIKKSTKKQVGIRKVWLFQRKFDPKVPYKPTFEKTSEYDVNLKLKINKYELVIPE